MDSNDAELEVTRLLDIIQKEQEHLARENNELAATETVFDPELQTEESTDHGDLGETSLNQNELENDDGYDDYPNKRVLTDFDRHLDQARDEEVDNHLSIKSATITASGLQKNCIPILLSFSNQVLEVLGYGRYQDTLNTVIKPDSQQGRAYQQLLHLFEETKIIYSEDKFLTSSPDDDSFWKTAYQRANLATFAAAVFGSIQVGFYHLNKRFTDCFVGSEGKFLKSHSILYLDLKTQAYISAMGQLEKSQEEILDQLFPIRDIQNEGATPTELDFHNKCQRRRQILQDADDLQELTVRYSWIAFMKDVHEYISKLISHNSTITSRPTLTTSHNAPSAVATTTNGDHPASGDVESGSDSFSHNTADGHLKRPRARRRAIPRPSNGVPMSDAAAAYEAARDTRNRPGVPSTFSRRPWTKQEEEALLKGLDKVQGPYWAQILELHGPGGSDSEILKDRTQVQLKDKARNLKLFFIKCGLPLPAVFEYVTGNIHSRRATAQKVKEKQKADEALIARTVPPPDGDMMTSPTEKTKDSTESPKQPADPQHTAETESIEKLIQSVGEYITSSSPAV